MGVDIFPSTWYYSDGRWLQSGLLMDDCEEEMRDGRMGMGMVMAFGKFKLC